MTTENHSGRHPFIIEGPIGWTSLTSPRVQDISSIPHGRLDPTVHLCRVTSQKTVFLLVSGTPSLLEPLMPFRYSDFTLFTPSSSHTLLSCVSLYPSGLEYLRYWYNSSNLKYDVCDPSVTGQNSVLLSILSPWGHTLLMGRRKDHFNTLWEWVSFTVT